MKKLDGVLAVCFDAFGTLVEITDPRRPFVPLFRALHPSKRRELKYRLMREERDPSTWPNALGVEIHPLIVEQMVDAVAAEVQSIRARPEVLPIWRQITSSGLKTAVCSNLASPYGSSVRQNFPASVEVFSYEVGAIKPEPAIYGEVHAGLDMCAKRVLFVGDTMSADVNGPAAFGFHSSHIDDLVAGFS